MPEYKLVLFTNFKPRVDGSDGAVWDRIRLIPFNVSFDGREDTELGEKLAAEAEGILAWLVEGCLEWQEDGLGMCDAVERATATYRTESDIIGRFVRDCCELDDEARVDPESPARRAARLLRRSRGRRRPAGLHRRPLAHREGSREARLDGSGRTVASG